MGWGEFGAERASARLRWLKTLHVLWRIARGGTPSPLRLIAQPITVETHLLQTRGGPIPAVIYRPSRPYATLIANGGFVRDSVDDPRLRNFAAALAETGFLVVTPDYPDVRRLTFTPATIDQIHDVFDVVRADSMLGGGGPLAVIGLSYMATLSLKAALRSDLRRPPEYLGVFGGYEDFRRLMHDVFQDEYVFAHERIPVDPYGRFLLLRSLVDYFDPPADERAAIRELAYRCGKCEPPDAIDAAAATLSPRGQKAFCALRAFHPARSPHIWQTMLSDHRNEFDALSISEPPERLRSRLVLLHSYYDHVLPYTASVALHDRFPQSELVLSRLFTHVNLRLNPLAAGSRVVEFVRVVRVFGGLAALQE